MKSKILTDRRLQSFRASENSDYLQVTLTLLLVFIFVAFAIRPSLLVAYTLYRNIKQYKEVDEKLAEKIIAIDEVRSTYRAISSDVILLDKSIPQKPDDGKLLTNLNYVGARNSVQLSRIVFTYTNKHDDLKIINISMEASGSYQNIKKFVDELSGLLRVVSINSINIHPISKLSENNKVVVTIKGKAFYE